MMPSYYGLFEKIFENAKFLLTHFPEI